MKRLLESRIFKKLYGPEAARLKYHRERFTRLDNKYQKYFGEAEYHFFSSPGRVEICGNHTDHNNGRVLAASVDLDVVAIVGENSENKIAVYSDTYDKIFSVDLDDLEFKPAETLTATSLIRGITAGFQKHGYQIGGFNACVSSDILPGSGLSSSASFEVLLATIISQLFNQGILSAEKISLLCQDAENTYFGKPCGLMDQLACAFGGAVGIDFRNPRDPQVYSLDFDFNNHPYQMLLVNTGGEIEAVREDFAAIRREMHEVAESLGVDCLREVDARGFKQMLPKIRKKLGDRPVLRAIHYIEENQRVKNQISALESDNFDEFLKLVNQSGASSARWLQNLYSNHAPQKQGLNLALALTENFIADSGRGACRVHGDGFAGTILVFILEKYLARYRAYMERVFGKKCIIPIKIRKRGALYLNPFLNVKGEKNEE